LEKDKALMMPVFYPKSAIAHSRLLSCLLAALILLALAGCGSSSSSGDAPTAVESYLKALVAKDANQVVNLSCAAWESEARVELDSFDAVTVTLEDPDCRENGQEGDYKLVSCSGKIVANYNGEDLEIDLGERNFQALYEGGDWRMCGYR
jgi:hypothetical protein